MHTYEVHPRFRTLVAPSTPARLQLAALYAATGSLLPEPGSRMTGTQTALLLVRQSWQVKPLAASELAQLRSAAALGGYMCPALRLAAYELEASASQLNELPFSGTGAQEAEPAAAARGSGAKDPALLADWRLAYLQATQVAPYANPRALLTHGEELRAVGHHARRLAPPPPLWKRLGHYQPIEVSGLSHANRINLIRTLARLLFCAC